MADDKEVVIRISAKNLTDEEFSKARKQLSGLKDDTEDSSKKTSGLGAALKSWAKEHKESISAVGSAIGITAGLVGGLAAGVVALGTRGATVSSLRGSFDLLAESAGTTGDVLLGKLSKSVDGLISRADLMKTANAAMSQGLKLSADQWELTGEAARIYADRLGIDLPTALGTLSQAMATGRDATLKSIGANIDGKKAVEDYAKALGKEAGELSESEQAIAKRNAILAMMRAEVERSGGAELDFAGRLDAVKIGLQDFTDSLGVAIAESPVLATIMEGIGGAMGEAFGETQQALIQTLIKIVNQGALYLIDFAQAGLWTAKQLANAFYGMRAIFGMLGEGVLHLIGLYIRGAQGLLEMGANIPIVGDKLKALARSGDGLLTWVDGAKAGMAAFKDESLDSAASIGTSIDKASGFLDKLRQRAEAAGQEQVSAAKISKTLADRHAELGEASGTASKAEEELAKKTRALADALTQAERKHVSSTAIVEQFGKAAHDLVEISGDAAAKLPAIILRADEAFRKSEINKIIAEQRQKANAEWDKYLEKLIESQQKATERMNAAFVKNLEAQAAALGEADELEKKRTLSAYDFQIYTIKKEESEKKASLDTHASNYSAAMAAIERVTAEKMAAASKAHKAAIDDMRGSTYSLRDAATIAFDQIGRAAGSQTIGGLGSMVGLFQQTRDLAKTTGHQFGDLSAAFDKNLSSGKRWGAGIQAGAAAAAGAMDVWNATANAGSKSAGALHGAMAGAKAGAAFGPWGIAIGAAGGALVGFIRNMNAGRKEVEKFADSFGGFDAMHVKLATLGDKGEQLWIKLTQGVGRSNPAQAKKVIEEINAAFADQGKEAERLSAAMEKYGLTWEDLGAKAKQAKIDADAKELILDFDALAGAGIDVNRIIEKMGDAINTFVQSAIRTGSEVPAAMRPMLEAMMAQGKLLDENGNAITDFGTAGIHFAETLTQGFDRMVEAINRVAKALGYDIPDAISKIPTRVDVDVNERHRKTYEDDEDGGGREPDHSYASGGIAAGSQIARVAEAGRKEIIGDEEFMTNAIAGALKRMAQPGSKQLGPSFVPGRRAAAGLGSLEIVLPIGRQVERYAIDLDREARRQGRPVERRTITERSF